MSRRRRPRWERKRARDAYPFVYTAKVKPTGRKGERCRIVGRAKVPEVVTVEFSDGGRFIVARRSLERAPVET